MLAAIGIVTLVLLVYRFYRSFLSDEGYLTFTLPAGIHAQLGAKLICAAVWIILTGVLVILSLLLTTSTFGEVLRLPWGELFARIYAESGIGAGSIIAFMFEILLAVVLGALASCLIFYASMSLGFGFSNHKVLYSVLILIGIGIVTQILSVSVLSGAAIHVGMGHHGVYMQFSPENLAHGHPAEHMRRGAHLLRGHVFCDSPIPQAQAESAVIKGNKMAKECGFGRALFSFRIFCEQISLYLLTLALTY